MRPRVEPFIYLSTEVDDVEIVGVFRHESTHLLLWCVEGNLDRKHLHPAFDIPDSPDRISVMEYADFIEETTWVCKEEIE